MTMWIMLAALSILPPDNQVQASLSYDMFQQENAPEGGPDSVRNHPEMSPFLPSMRTLPNGCSYRQLDTGPGGAKDLWILVPRDGAPVAEIARCRGLL